MSELADFLHKLIDAIDRPADHPAAELHQEVDSLASEPPAPEPSADQGLPAPEPPADVTGPYDAPPDDASQPPADA